MIAMAISVRGGAAPQTARATIRRCKLPANRKPRQGVGEPGRPHLPWKQESGGSNPPALTNSTAVIPEAAQRLSGIHNHCPWVWIPGSRLSARPGMTAPVLFEDKFAQSPIGCLY